MSSSSIAATRGTAAAGRATALRQLYLVRSGFALVWAILLFLTASNGSPLTAVLLVLYPVFDVAAAVVDVRSQRVGASRGAVGLVVNITVSTLAALGLAVALTSGIPAVLRVWGAWALLAGALQLVVAVGRRRLGGQSALVRTAGNNRHVAVLGGARVGRVVAQRQPQEHAFDHAHPARRDR